ncbi:MAG TPA: hypothetical protein VFC35_08905, partial [Gemmatimonadaceae bacterium]|nr:hypothetical protein [Gemmatimonadaceae bacterium]
MSEAVDALAQVEMMAATLLDSQKSPTTAIEAYRWDFDEVDRSSREPEWLRSIRRSAMDRFESDGFPSMKNEDWHFTNVGPIAEHKFQPARKGSAVSSDVLSRIEYGQDWH